MAWFTIQTSQHPLAEQKLLTAEVRNSWLTIFDGEIRSDAEVRRTLVTLTADGTTSARAFKGKNIGRLWAAIYNGRDKAGQ
jgi:hypothetical protein